MKISNHAAVPVYTISGSSTARPLPEWLARKRKRSLKHDPDYNSRIELLQDFEFEEASQCIRISDDGQWVMSTGRYGRDLKYNKASAEALIPAVGLNKNGMGEVFRLNLEAGSYMRAYEVRVDESYLKANGTIAFQGGMSNAGVMTAAVAEESHNLLAFGTSLGTVEFWDPRSRGQIGLLQSFSHVDLNYDRQEITALEFDRSGLGIAVGSSTGLINLYDLRSPNPVLKKDQGYGFPIQNIIYLSPSTSSRHQISEPRILSADKRIIKIWDPHDGSPWTSVEPAVDLHSVAWCKDSGMLLTANEGRQQHSFFIPQLGPAPKWCSFLDSLVEEMAEDPDDPNAFQSQKAGQVYDNYKFLTMQQLETLNLSHLVGTTSLLRPYMHGYFVAQRLYEEAKMIANPFVWEEQKNKRVKEKIDAERESRIRGNKKVAAKVNKRLAEKMMERQEREEKRQARMVLENGGDESKERGPRKEEKPGSLLADPRFAKLFQDEDFAIDERSREFQLLNPSTKPTPLEPSNGNERRLTAMEEEALDEVHSADTESSSGNEEKEEKRGPKPKTNSNISSASYKRSGHRPLQPQMLASSTKRLQQVRDIPFGSREERIKASKLEASSAVGEREITFAPEKKGKGPKIENAERRRDNNDRRSASGNIFRNM